uniref:Uncharacterized protein n=1 Tax=Euplotes harpa TaxID=151035 RepID=A0A7S3N7J9_9SPIT|mmetsp:Transcript_15024/g.17350  ORF Transcript_15024/g.17350 Transcript_15024/m.17350 type:complete len:118 (+) Transcript_15024:2-355(+)
MQWLTNKTLEDESAQAYDSDVEMDESEEAESEKSEEEPDDEYEANDKSKKEDKKDPEEEKNKAALEEKPHTVNTRPRRAVKKPDLYAHSEGVLKEMSKGKNIESGYSFVNCRDYEQL